MPMDDPDGVQYDRIAVVALFAVLKDQAHAPNRARSEH
jgi:hypothetical protein